MKRHPEISQGEIGHPAPHFYPNRVLYQVSDYVDVCALTSTCSSEENEIYDLHKLSPSYHSDVAVVALGFVVDECLLACTMSDSK